MFLNRLSSEQKDLFFDLCIHASMANNDFAEEEKLMIQQYCDEMQLSDVRYEANLDLDKSVSKLVEISSKAELKMMTLELTGLILSDNKYDDFEKTFMHSFAEKAQMSNDEYNEIFKVVNDLNDLYKKIGDIISK